MNHIQFSKLKCQNADVSSYLCEMAFFNRTLIIFAIGLFVLFQQPVF